MIIVRERFESRGKRIGWSSLLKCRAVGVRSGMRLHVHGTHLRSALECSACRSDRDVVPADNLANTGFCNDCLDGSRSHVELGGES